MNLIEHLGGYEAAKVEFNNTSSDQYGYKFSLQMALLSYRRQHNIYGVGDWVVKASRLNDDKVYQVFEVADSLNWVKTSCGAFIDAPMFKHATDEEIKAGRRLPQLEVLNAPNTIILGDK